MAPTGLDFMTTSTPFGVEYHSAADFLADGLKLSVSASTDTGAEPTTTGLIVTSRLVLLMLLI